MYIPDKFHKDGEGPLLHVTWLDFLALSVSENQSTIVSQYNEKIINWSMLTDSTNQ